MDTTTTDLIAEARKAAKRANYYRTGEAGLFYRLALALEFVTKQSEPDA